MSLYLIRGTISQLGQCEFDNDLIVYAYIEIMDAVGARTLVRRVAIATDIQATIEPGIQGSFFFDELFVPGRRILCQLWGISTVERRVVDRVNLRAILTFWNVVRGILFTPVLGIGLTHLLAGIGQMWSFVNGAANRDRFFQRAERGEIVSPKPGPPMPEKLGLALRTAGTDLLRKHLRTFSDRQR